MHLFYQQHSRLVKGCIANERLAQEGLYKLFYAEMLRVCYRYLKSDELAQEALNNAFLKIFQHISTFDEKKGRLATWIKTIVIRTCIDIGRKEIKFSNENSIADAEHIFIAPEVLSKLYAEDLLKCIRQLPAATQLVFNLAVIEGFSHKEIGEQLNISESTSRWHLSEGKKQLRAILTLAGTSINPPTDHNNKAI